MENLKVSTSLLGELVGFTKNRSKEASLGEFTRYKTSNNTFTHYKGLNNISTDDFVRFLYVGYEVEETPEEKLLRIYNENHEIACTTPVVAYRWRAKGFNEGVRYMCREYGIKIEGIEEE